MHHAKPTLPTLADYEIMAPVGSRESLAAAIQAGADSIYFGIGRLNMRAHSANTFTTGDLRDIAAECAAHGIRTYLTVNTIIYDEDMDAMREAVDAAREAGITAVIASDVAVMDYCRRVGMEVHLSTQLNISNTEALRFYSRYADVAVLARELRLEQVAEIHRRIEQERICGPSGQPVRIEMFCHGALCMAVSGKCYMSLDNAGRSANRGECVQICRRSYTVTDTETGCQLEIDNKYIMSPEGPEDRALHRPHDGGRREGVQDRGQGARPGVRLHRGELLQRRPYGPCSTARSPTSARTSGTAGSQRCSTAASGTATTRASALASGTAATAPAPPSARSTWAGARSISQVGRGRVQRGRRRVQRGRQDAHHRAHHGSHICDPRRDSRRRRGRADGAPGHPRGLPRAGKVRPSDKLFRIDVEN